MSSTIDVVSARGAGNRSHAKANSVSSHAANNMSRQFSQRGVGPNGLQIGIPGRNDLAANGAAQIGFSARTSSNNLATIAGITDQTSAFKIKYQRGIPDGKQVRSNSRKAERLESLLRMPDHKSGTQKFNGEPAMRTLAPLTYEDTGQFDNLPLISTLREAKGINVKTRASMQNTYASPPHDYDQWVEKWQEKFSGSIKARETFKNKFLKTQNMSILTSQNDNAMPGTDPDKKLEGIAYTGGQVKAKKSEFKKVQQRRRSRLSTHVPTNVDFEYIGNSGQFSHLIGKATASNLNYNMNLRAYKNTTDYKAEKPWQYPATKEFSPRAQYAVTNEVLGVRGKDFQDLKFRDKFEEKNANEILHNISKDGLYQTAGWHCSLRGDRKEREETKQKTKAVTDRQKAHY